MIKEIGHGLRRRADDRRAGSESFDNRYGHVIQPRCIDKNIRLLVIPTDVAAGSYPAEIYVAELQVGHEFPHVAFGRAISHKVEASVWKFTLHLCECFYNHIHAVIGMKPAGTDQVWPQRSPL